MHDQVCESSQPTFGKLRSWRLEHVSRNSNEKADALAAVAASMPIKETMLLPVYY